MRTELAQQFQQIEAVSLQLVKMMTDLASARVWVSSTPEERLALLLISKQRDLAVSILNDLSAINDAANNLRQE